MTKENPKWADFENLVATIQRKTAPFATVRQNHFVLGISGSRRQLDVTLTQRIGTQEVFIVLECKRFGRPVTIKEVEAFVTKLRDVRGNHGVIVSNSGFTEGAVGSARSNNITLQSLRQAQMQDWEKVVGGAAWCSIVLTKHYPTSAALVTRDERISLRPEGKLALREGQSLELSTLFEESSAALGSEMFVGSFTTSLEVNDGRLEIVHEGRLLDVERLEFEGNSRAFKYCVNLELASGHVLAEHESGRSAFVELTTEGFDWRAAINSQTPVELTDEELQTMRKSQPGNVIGQVIDSRKTKQYLRFVVTSTPGA